jgi:DNA-binding response OmpR family regulator
VELSRPTILVVEDEVVSRRVLAELLAGDGYIVETAGDGRAGLERVEAGGIHVVLLDLVLPELDGLELCRRVRARVDEVYLPIIMMTALTGEQERLDGFAAGADDYVIKPFKFDELRARVQVWVRTSQRLQAAHARLVHQRAVLAWQQGALREAERRQESGRRDQLVSVVRERTRQLRGALQPADEAAHRLRADSALAPPVRAAVEALAVHLGEAREQVAALEAAAREADLPAAEAPAATSGAPQAAQSEPDPGPSE